MALTIVTSPTTEPLSLADVREHLRLEETEGEIGTLNALITTARLKVEELTQRGLIDQTWDYRLDSFPTIIEIPLSPLDVTAPITSVKYIDTNGDEQTLVENTDYTVDKYSEPGRIMPAYGKSWPSTRSVPNAVTVKFVAGYGVASDVPKPIKQAILVLVAHWYEHREEAAPTAGGPITQVPFMVDALLSPYTRVTL